MDKPTIWKFIESLKMVQKGRDAFYESLVAGRQAPEKLKKYRDDLRLQEMVKSFDSTKKLEFLRGVAYNYQMKN